MGASEPERLLATVVGPAGRPARRRLPRRARLGAAATPYLLLAPATAVIGLVLAYPLYELVRLSFERYGLFELLRHHGTFVGLANYSSILHDATFWEVLLRTAVFTLANVALTMLLATLIALLLAKLGTVVRLVLSAGLVLVWAMPPVVSVNIWEWMVDYEFGVANWTLTKLGVGDFVHHEWFDNPVSGLGIVTAMVVWGAIPFVAITLYAGLTQVPGDLVEAAAIDGASPLRVFRDVTFPILKPIFVICASLSVIWDFQVFNQIWIVRNARPEPGYWLIGIYSFVTSFSVSNYGLGSAIAVVMVLVMLGFTFVYVRQMVRLGEME